MTTQFKFDDFRLEVRGAYLDAPFQGEFGYDYNAGRITEIRIESLEKNDSDRWCHCVFYLAETDVLWPMFAEQLVRKYQSAIG